MFLVNVFIHLFILKTEFKPVELHLKMDLALYPTLCRGVGYIHFAEGWRYT